jgi:ubiquinone/menaquinone biosynthesis C-methylase UbiE
MYNPIQFVNSDYLEQLGNKFNHIKQKTYELMKLDDDSSVLDAGCGPGIDTIILGKTIVTKGTVTGFDFDEQMVTEANRRAAGEGLFPRVSHLHCSAVSLPFENESFHSVRSERMLQHLVNPLEAISELVRVCKKGGTIVVADSDHSSLSIDCAKTETEWKLRKFRTDFLPNGYAGRSLFSQFKICGLENINMEFFSIIVNSYKMYRYFSCMDLVEKEALKQKAISIEELNTFNIFLENADNCGRFFCYITIIVASGIKA